MAELEVGTKHISGSPLSFAIIPAGNSVSSAIIRANIEAGAIYQFDISTSDKYGNLISVQFYVLYGPRIFSAEMRFNGISGTNTSLGAIVDRQGDVFIQSPVHVILVVFHCQNVLTGCIRF